MLEKNIAEATDCDFKVAVERRKPKSWLKSVSAFANSIGGMLIFGVDNEQQVIGLDSVQDDAESISRLIKERILPLPRIELIAFKERGNDILCLKILPGSATPYYYKADGIMEAYIRVGNESIVAPEHILNELILKGTNKSFDAMISDVQKSDYSFTLFEATYLEQAGSHIKPTDYHSFGLCDKQGFLSNAGKLMADQYIVRNSRVFCTRWNGIEKGSIFDDALDDKEYEGNLLSLLRNSSDFVRNNSKVRFVKDAQYRVDKPDYSERAITEAIVNALIHRDYVLLGTEIHIDMFDDRLEIQSPGGMVDGRAIQDRDIRAIVSARRNPIIADLFHRMKYMERRGSGLSKILDETAKLPGYTERMQPEFISTASDFRVVLTNVNWNPANDTAQVTAQDSAQDTAQDNRVCLLLAFCSIPRSREEMQTHIGIEHREYFRKFILKPLLESGNLQMTLPGKPTSRNQKYIAKEPM
nr:ATP-binding protein [uncultured Sphaerochaeta sp.]